MPINLPTGSLGIDVSHWNTVNWLSVTGIRFAIVACGDGLTEVDPNAVNNIKLAKSQGLAVGGYLVVRVMGTSVTEVRGNANAQAARFLQVIKEAGGYDGEMLPPVADVESFTDTTLMVEALDQFCSSVDAAIRNPAQRTMIYSDLSNQSALSRAGNVDLIKDREWWIAWYNPGTPPKVIPFNPASLIQFTDHKALSGSPKPVDWDRVLVGTAINPVVELEAENQRLKASLQQIAQIATGA